MHTRPTLFIASLTALCIVSTAAAQSLLQSDSRDNARWTRTGSSATITAQQDSTPELEMNLAAFRSRPVTFTFTTDAEYVRVRGGSRTTKLELSGNQHTLVLSAGPTPIIQLNGRTDPDATEDWTEGIARDGADKVSLRFARCDRVTISWTTGAAAPSDPAAASTASHTPVPTPPQPLGTTAITERLEQALVELHIDRGIEGVSHRSQAVIINEDGYALGNLHPLLGAKQLTADLKSSAKSLGVQLLAVDLDRDLALLRIDLSDPLVKLRVKPLDYAAVEPAEEDILYLAHVRDGRHRVTQTAVEEAAITYARLGRSWRNTLDHDATTRWVEIDINVSPRNAGGPVVDRFGRLVGFAAFTWAIRGDNGLVMRTDAIDQLLGAAQSSALTLDQLPQTLGDRTLPHTSFPRVVFTAERSADEYNRLVILFKRLHNCELCKGNGLQTTRVRTGSERHDNVLVPRFENRDTVCPRCNGTGLNKTDPIMRSLDNLARTLAHVDPNDPALDKHRRSIQTAFREIAEKHTLQLQRLFNEQYGPVLTGGADQIGQPVFLIGPFDPDLTLPGSNKPFVGVGIVRDRRPGTYCFVTNPLIPSFDKTDTALVGGILAGFTDETAANPPMPIITHGVVIPLPQPETSRRR